MANRSNATINQTINYLLAKINNLPPSTIPSLDQVLTVGDSAGTNDIDMNQNDITEVLNIINSSADLNLSATGVHNISMTAGGYFNLVATGPSYINGSFIELISSANTNFICPTGAYFSTNPFTPLVGDAVIYGSAKRVSITDDTTTTGTFYPTFVNGSGNGKDLSVDRALNFNGLTNTLTCPNFAGNASNASNASQISLTTDNTNGTYFIPFSKTANANNNNLFVDNSIGPLTYNPAGSQLTCQSIVAQIALPTATDTLTFSGTTLSASFPGTSIRGFRAYITGTTNTISTLNFSGAIVNSQFTITIRNDGTGNLTINNSFSPSSTYITGNYPVLTIPPSGTAIMYVRRLTIPVNGDVYFINVEPLGLGAVLDTLSQTLINGNSAGTTDIDMNSQNITNVNTLSSASGSILSINAESNLNLTSVNNGINITAPNGSISLDSIQTDIIGGTVNLTATSTSANVSGPIIDLVSINDINLTSNNANIGLNANVDINLLTSSGNINFQSVQKGIIFNAGDGVGGNNDISLTTINGVSSGGIIGNIDLNSAGYINLTTIGSDNITLTSNNQINMTATQSTMSLLSQFDLNLESQISPITLLSTDIININAPNSNSYGYALPICLNQFEQGTWSYTLGGQMFQNVFSTNIALPTQFFAENPPSGYTSTRWQINFDMNCWNFANADDKGFAIYVSFIDSNSNVYEPFLYNNQTPFCKWDNAPTFTGTFSQFKSINWCDYVDLNGLVGSNDSNIKLQMYIAADNIFNNVEFKLKLGFTRIQRI